MENIWPNNIYSTAQCKCIYMFIELIYLQPPVLGIIIENIVQCALLIVSRQSFMNHNQQEAMPLQKMCLVASSIASNTSVCNEHIQLPSCGKVRNSSIINKTHIKIINKRPLQKTEL